MRWNAVTGAWPAIWMMPVQGISGASETGVLAIFEGGQGSNPLTYYGTIHDYKNGQDVWNNSGSNAYQLPNTVDLTQYHVYGALWTPGHVTWYFDNQPILTSTTPAIFDSQDYYLVLGSQEGVNWTSGNLSGVTASSIAMNVDWVHVWQSAPSTTSSPSALQIGANTPPAGTVNTAYTTTLSATGGTPPYSWSLASGSLPTGLALSSSGVISGTPSASGTYSFSVKVTDSAAQTATSGTLSLTVNAAVAALQVTTTTLPSGTASTAYSSTLWLPVASPYTWSLASGSLPPFDLVLVGRH